MTWISRLSFGLDLARLFVIIVAAGAIGWAVIVVPKFWSEAIVSEAATHIIAGEIYKPEYMEVLETAVDRDRGATLRSSILGKAAIIQLRRAEDTIAAGDQQVIDARLNSLDQSINDALTNSPSDPFLWLVSFWLDSTRNGFSLRHSVT